MEGGTGFGIDSILSHRPGSPAGGKGDTLMGEGRSPLELSPGSEGSSGCSPSSSPGRECMEAGGPRHGGALGMDCPLPPGGAPISAPSQSRTVTTSSFLIRDILADCKPLAACAPYSSNGQPTQEPVRCLVSRGAEDFRDKLERGGSNASSDSEYRGEEGRAGGGGARAPGPTQSKGGTEKARREE
ncbi:hypothetical protein NDU88_000669 [Pleurodeles waltl]|uniref:BARH1 protein n=1 Tax=Pleurodeles waltl TaxID=8319 RepID=A0AAV7Q3T7_PLEWA|nr:hypothetical protein NDU88_000669 [Pleurodeles waltl]